MDDYLDKSEADLLEKVNEVNDRDVSSQKKLQDQCEALFDEMEEFQRKLDQCKDNVNHLFVTSKRIQKKMEKCQKINETISAKSQINTLNF
jgi:predicted RNase H-like nuclease (RuvC/YqgF family)